MVIGSECEDQFLLRNIRLVLIDRTRNHIFSCGINNSCIRRNMEIFANCFDDSSFTVDISSEMSTRYLSKEVNILPIIINYSSSFD